MRDDATKFIAHVRQAFPFRIHAIQTDNDHEFKASFHWRCKYLGIRHVYIKSGSPHLNGRIERSHWTSKQQFCQLVDCVDDIDIEAKLKEWEVDYNCQEPKTGLKRKGLNG